MTTLDQCTDISGGTKMFPFYVSGEPTSAFDIRPVNINAPLVDDCRIYIIEGSEGSIMIMADYMPQGKARWPFAGVRSIMIMTDYRPRAAGTSSASLNKYLKTSIDKISSMSNSMMEGMPLLSPSSDPETTSEAVFELHRISGLDWGELAQLFDVSRDTIHSWISGGLLDIDQWEQVRDVLEVVRHVDRGTSVATREALCDTDTDTGKSPFELLAERQYKKASKALGKGTPMYEPKLGELDQESKDAREPLPLEVLVNARNDRIHNDTGRTRVVRGVRYKRRDGT